MDAAPGGPLAGLQESLSAALPHPRATSNSGGGGGAMGHLNPSQFSRFLGGGEEAVSTEAAADLLPLAVAA